MPVSQYEAQIDQLTRERDGARARITDLEAQLAATAKPEVIQPSAADLDKVAEEQKAASDTAGGGTSVETEQAQHE